MTITKPFQRLFAVLALALLAVGTMACASDDRSAAERRADKAYERVTERLNETLDELRKRLSTSPKNVVVRNMLAFALYTTGQYGEALEHFRIVADTGQSTFFTQYYMGQTLARLGNLAQAVSCWNRALDFDLPDEVRKKVAQRVERAQKASGFR